MDPERQPLLLDVRCRRFRPLTYEEVITARNHSIWRRSRLLLVLMFWATMAMFLSIIACLLFNSRCNVESAAPGVPPVHLTLAPLMASGRKEAYTRIPLLAKGFPSFLPVLPILWSMYYGQFGKL